ncbi:hypothetical protein GOHSU_24_00530 [Gordonia hirsuta DSM 44140 = NBRC 16056]|uniref:DUF2804 family protein n=1 Tax=Gordonia hirsuta DSM 44140 = NBRC 16056 TaxID=1121927 RepID=L7LA09_9ACTN|nr:DUF2804 family protein [Gordonia hirsuta]GAC57764.1 hypothetical protein GOHSU_24_00530 [Gordonia hirsuta DSM 44140 = NBRC 16056]
MSTPIFPPAPTPPPPALVEDGRYAFGTYDGPIPLINPLDAGTRLDAEGTPHGRFRSLRRMNRNLRLKEWEAFQLGDDDWFVLGAVYNAKTIGLIQILAVNKNDDSILRWETKMPAPTLSVARGLLASSSRGRVADFRVEIGNHLERDRIAVDAHHPGRGDLPSMGLHVVGSCGPEEAAHLVTVHPFSVDRALYSHKVMMPMDGSLVIGGERVGIAADRGFLILDDHHGDYPRPMRYDWVTAARRAPGNGGDPGRVEGFNLTANQILDPAVFNENALWIGNTLHRLPPVTVERPQGPWGKWLIRDASGAVDVTFTPTVRSTMHVGPRKALAAYYAPYGWYEGAIEAQGATLNVDGMFGVGEQKRITL